MPHMQKSPILLVALLLMTVFIASPVYAAEDNTAVSLLNDMSKATKITEGKGPKTLYILYDPNCPYCHLLFKELRPYVSKGEVTIHWVTVGILTPTSPGKAAAILQAKNPLKAFYRNEHGWYGNDQPGGGITPLRDPNANARKELKFNDDLLAEHGLTGVPITLFTTTDGSPFYFEGTPSSAKLAEILKYVK